MDHPQNDSVAEQRTTHPHPPQVAPLGSKPWPTAVLNHWFAAAQSHRLRHRPLGIEILNTPLALSRQANGAIIALEDRCPHRLAPLSQGCQNDKGLSCPYHGWTFDAFGRLVDIPGLSPSDTLPSISVPSYEVQELGGLIWVRKQNRSDLAQEVVPKSDSTLNSCIQKWAHLKPQLIWQTILPAHIIDALENFLDPCHTHFVHSGLVRQSQVRVKARADYVQQADGFYIDYQGQPQQSGWLYRLFESPRVSERAYFAHPGTAQLDYVYQNGSRVVISLHFTPEDFAHTHMFATVHINGRWAPAWLVRLLVGPFLKKVVRQDAQILRMQRDHRRRFSNYLGPCQGVTTALDLSRRDLEAFWLQKHQTEASEGALEGQKSKQVEIWL